LTLHISIEKHTPKICNSSTFPHLLLLALILTFNVLSQKRSRSLRWGFYVLGLLESHQSVQEGFVEEWKGILEDVVKYCSLCTDQFLDLESRVSKIVEGIQPENEYIMFKEKFR